MSTTARLKLTTGGIALLCLVLLGALFVTVNTNETATSQPPFARYDDKIADYGVCRGTDPACYNEWPAAHRNNEIPRVLIFSHTGAFRHGHLGPPLGSGMNPPLQPANLAQQAIVDWGDEFGFKVDWTEDLTQLDTPQRLLPYNAVIFLSNSREVLNDAARTSLTQYIRSGGGFVAIHNTLGAEYNWPHFQGLLGGTNFYDHGPHQTGVVETVNRSDVSTTDLPARWDFRDEWYNLEPFPDHFDRILLAVDTDTFGTSSGPGFLGHPGHPGDHPISWCQYYDGGRSWVTSLGHDNGAWTGALEGSEHFKTHVVNGILSAAGAEPFCQ